MRLFAGCLSSFCFTMANNFMFQHKHRILIVHSICSLQCVCMLFFSFFLLPWLSFPLFLCIPSPSLFQHLCWVHARASDKALCVPSPWQPAMLPFLARCPTILETSQLFALLLYATIPLQPGRSPEDRRTHPCRDRITLKHLDLHLLRKGEEVSVRKAMSERWSWSQGEQSLHYAISHFAALGHKIKRSIHCRSLESFLWSASWAASCLNSLTSPPLL